jgi:hypothetical protein
MVVENDREQHERPVPEGVVPRDHQGRLVVDLLIVDVEQRVLEVLHAVAGE